MRPAPRRWLVLTARSLALATPLALAAASLSTSKHLDRLESWSAAILWQAAPSYFNAALGVAFGAVLAWLLCDSLGARLSTDTRRRALAATAIAITPGVGWLILWVNRHALPDLLSAPSIVGNVVLLAAAVALVFPVARGMRRWRERADRGLGISAVLLLVPIGVNAVGLASKPSGPNVIVILIDVLGARHMSCYGYERETTPHIDRLAEDGLLFEQAIAQSSFTKTSVASLFTGLWPHNHGVYLGALKVRDDTVFDVLGDEVTTIAESLQSAGYQTVAWVPNGQCRRSMGFGQGFGLYVDRLVHVDEMSTEFTDWLEEWASAGPFFAYLHVLDLHGPYRPVPPYDEMFGRPSDMEMLDWPEWNRYKREVILDEYDPPDDEVAQLRAWYDGQLAWVDAKIGLLLDHLRETGLYDDSMIILVSDHGDGFMQHGTVGHSTTPFDELIHVPLIVKLPGSKDAGRRVPEQVALVDLAPTLERLLGAEPQIGRWGDGTPLAALLDGEGGSNREWVFSEFDREKVVRSGEWKFVWDGKEPQLFDLRNDAGETTNVIEDRPDLAEELGARAREILGRHMEGQAERRTMDEETIRRLTELGYL